MSSLLLFISKGRGQKGDGDWDAGEIIAVRNPIPNHGKETPLFGRIFVPDVPEQVDVGRICTPFYAGKSGHDPHSDEYIELHYSDMDKYPREMIARRRFYIDETQYQALDLSHFSSNDTATVAWASVIFIDRVTGERAADQEFYQ